MPAKNILVVAIDGLRASSLGAYGNTSYLTPAFDEFASEGFLLDACFALSTTIPPIYRALWQSLDPLRTENFASSSFADITLPSLLRWHRYTTSLITDDASMLSLPLASEFDECFQITDVADKRADEVEQTSLSHLLAAGAEMLPRQGDSPRLLWIHSRGMYGPWDAPLQLQESLLDDEDPPPLESIEPPNLSIDEADDPDTAFRYGCAYAAQIMALDIAWEGFMRAINVAGRDDWLVMLLGVRGFPLGEHRQIGGVDERLYVEQLHVPWLIRFPEGEGRLSRSRSLTSHLDLLPTILDWVQDAANTQPSSPHLNGESVLPLLRDPWLRKREMVLASSPGGAIAIRTPAWSMLRDGSKQRRKSADTTAEIEIRHEPELFVRPDDRWEANDVAGLCPAIVETLERGADEVAAQLGRGEPVSYKPLPDELRAHER